MTLFHVFCASLEKMAIPAHLTGFRRTTSNPGPGGDHGDTPEFENVWAKSVHLYMVYDDLPPLDPSIGAVEEGTYHLPLMTKKELIFHQSALKPTPVFFTYPNLGKTNVFEDGYAPSSSHLISILLDTNSANFHGSHFDCCPSVTWSKQFTFFQ